MPFQDGFQSFVNNELPPAIAGDFASANPRASIIGGGEFAYTAAANGLVVGVFSWSNPSTGIASNFYQANSFLGFFHRAMNALITQFLGFEATAAVPGTMVDTYDQGEFWGYFAGGATAGQKVYADPLYGILTSNTTGNSVGGAITSVSIATTGVMTVNTITGTPLAVNQAISLSGGATGSIPPGTYIASLGTGTGGAGTYNLANANGSPFTVVTAQAAAYAGVQETNYFVADNILVGASVTASIAAGIPGVMTVTAVGSGTLSAGQFLAGAGIPANANAQIQYQITSTAAGGALGGTGTYAVNYPGVVASQTITATAGQIGMISSWL